MLWAASRPAPATSLTFISFLLRMNHPFFIMPDTNTAWIGRYRDYDRLNTMYPPAPD